MDAWGIDIVISASQKGLGIPPGLSITCASEKAIKVITHLFFTLRLESHLLESRSSNPGRRLFLLIMLAGRSTYMLIHVCISHNTSDGPQNRWLPIMRAYENGTSAYFATPSVNLIYAFHTSLTQITKGVPSLEDRFQLHREASRRIKAAVENLGLRQLPVKPEQAANGMTAVSLLTPFFFQHRTTNISQFLCSH